MKATEKPERPPLLVDVKEVARLLGVGERTVWSKVASGAMPQPVRIGKLCRWVRTDIEEWVAGGCPRIESTSSKK